MWGCGCEWVEISVPGRLTSRSGAACGSRPSSARRWTGSIARGTPRARSDHRRGAGQWECPAASRVREATSDPQLVDAPIRALSRERAYARGRAVVFQEVLVAGTGARLAPMARLDEAVRWSVRAGDCCAGHPGATGWTVRNGRPCSAISGIRGAAGMEVVTGSHTSIIRALRAICLSVRSTRLGRLRFHGPRESRCDLAGYRNYLPGACRCGAILKAILNGYVECLMKTPR